jgi:hypothetical protein
MAQSTIQRMGNSPKAAPLVAAPTAVFTGIPNTTMATSSEAASPARAARWALTRSSPSSPRRTTIGRAATRAESRTLSATGV